MLPPLKLIIASADQPPGGRTVAASGYAPSVTHVEYQFRDKVNGVTKVVATTAPFKPFGERRIEGAWSQLRPATAIAYAGGTPVAQWTGVIRLNANVGTELKPDAATPTPTPAPTPSPGPTPSPAPTPAPLPIPEQPQGNTPSTVRTFTLGTGLDDVSPTMLRASVAAGVPSVRLWCGHSTSPAKLAAFQWSRSHGGQTMASIVPEITMNRTAAEAIKFAAMHYAAYGSHVDVWSLHNEPELAEYGKWDARTLMEQFIKPVSAFLRGKGAKVISPPIAASVSFFRQLADAHLSDHVDGYDIHPYQDTTAGHISILNQFQACVNDAKPWYESECNLQASASWLRTQNRTFDQSRYIIEFPKLTPALAANRVTLAYLFILHPHPGSDWQASPVNADGTPHEPFYSLVRAAAGAK